MKYVKCSAVVILCLNSISVLSACILILTWPLALLAWWKMAGCKNLTANTIMACSITARGSCNSVMPSFNESQFSQNVKSVWASLKSQIYLDKLRDKSQNTESTSVKVRSSPSWHQSCDGSGVWTLLLIWLRESWTLTYICDLHYAQWSVLCCVHRSMLAHGCCWVKGKDSCTFQPLSTKNFTV